MTPAKRNDSHTAAPATAPAAPRSAKIPAPTIAPTPMNAAWRTVRYFSSGDDIAGGPFLFGRDSLPQEPAAPTWPVCAVAARRPAWGGPGAAPPGAPRATTLVPASPATILVISA